MTGRGGSGKTRYTMPTERDFVATRAFRAPRRVVFDAWTTPEHMKEWLLGPDGWAMSVCEIDLHAGGPWRVVWRDEDGAELAMGGVYREVVPPERVVSTEKWGPEWPETINTAEFTESGGLTTITLTMSYPTKKAREAAVATEMKEGMDEALDRLEAFLSTLM